MTLTYAPPGWAPWGGNEATCDCGNEFIPDGDQEECDDCEALEREYLKEQDDDDQD